VSTPFDDTGAAVEAIDFDFDAIDGQPLEAPSRGDAGESVARLLEWLTAGQSVEAIGRRTVLVGCLLSLPGSPKTLRALGRRLGLSHEHARRLLAGIRSELRQRM
jgi:hypothetical protein